jgi:Uma2 family endonuclease
MADPAKRRATYQDVLDAPVHMVAEVVDGELYTHPRPRPLHAEVASVLGMDLGSAFRRGRGGPGGWWILDEPELHLGPEPDIIVPDLAGWRRARMSALPDEAYFSLSPDWACEVLSTSTAQLDRTRKVPIYAREKVPHVWLVDPDAKTLEIFELDGDTYRLAATHGGDAVVRAVPFDAIELELAALWGK